MQLRTSRPNLTIKIVAAENTANIQQKMWQLYSRYYEIPARKFFSRFKDNDYYALFMAKDSIVGFTALRIKRVTTAYEKCLTIYTGHAVIDPEFRGQSMITRTFFRLVARHFLTHPGERVYVWCDALTYRAFLSFTRSLKTYYPSRKEETPQKAKAVLDQLGQHYYGSNYDSEKGTVRKKVNIVDDPSARITDELMANPDIAFFAGKNQRHEEGHGLLMLAPASREFLVRGPAMREEEDQEEKKE